MPSIFNAPQSFLSTLPSSYVLFSCESLSITFPLPIYGVVFPSIVITDHRLVIDALRVFPHTSRELFLGSTVYILLVFYYSILEQLACVGRTYFSLGISDRINQLTLLAYLPFLLSNKHFIIIMYLVLKEYALVVCMIHISWF